MRLREEPGVENERGYSVDSRFLLKNLRFVRPGHATPLFKVLSTPTMPHVHGAYSSAA